MTKDPTNLEECFVWLETNQPKFTAEVDEMHDENKMIKFHHSAGRSMRNMWFWSDSPFKEYFLKLGLNHPDDMSGVVLYGFWRHRHNKPIELQKQIEDCKQYWNNLSISEILR